jgi:PncC family amidohydrolase
VNSSAQDLDALLREIQALLLARHATVATAESCTGGLLAASLTRLAGSSAAYLGGVSAYANAVKERMLGVDAATIARVGAVSAEVATAMAQGARARIGADYAISLTGIAGPSGGTAEKPVGTVFGAVATPTDTRAHRWLFPGDREAVRQAAAHAALAALAAVLRGA